MISRLIVFLVLVLSGINALAQRPASYSEAIEALIVSDSREIVITNVRVIVGTGAPAIEAVNVHIQDGLIYAIDPSPGSPLAHRIDGTGKTLVPGFVMFHEHLLYLNGTVVLPNYSSEAVSMPPLYLAAGATTIRTAGTMNGHHDLQIKQLIEAGRWPGPDVHVTAAYINGSDGFAYQMPITDDPEQARLFVRYWTDRGASSLKAYMNVSQEVLSAAIDEAHAQGATVTGHLCSVTYKEAAAMGIDNLEHGLVDASDLIPEKQDGECPNLPLAERIKRMQTDSPEVQQIISTLVEHDVAITSTLPVFAAGVHPAIPTEESLNLLSPRSKSLMQERWTNYLGNRDSERGLNLRKRLELEMAFEKAFVDAGGTLLVGTDPTGWGGTIPPNSTHSALILLVEAGFTPLQAIYLSTLNGAEYLGEAEHIGSIENGKRANLVLIDGRPDIEISDIQHVELVFKDGVAFDSDALIESVRGTLGR